MKILTGKKYMLAEIDAYIWNMLGEKNYQLYKEGSLLLNSPKVNKMYERIYKKYPIEGQRIFKIKI